MSNKSTGPGGGEVPIIRRLAGNVRDGLCVAHVRLRSSPNEKAIEAVISTAITLSTIQPELVAELRLPVIDTERIWGADDSEERSIDVVFAEIFFTADDGNLLSIPTRLGVAPSRAQMLLGMDILSEAVFTLNMPESVWTWDFRIR